MPNAAGHQVVAETAERCADRRFIKDGGLLRLGIQRAFYFVKTAFDKRAGFQF